MRTDELIDSLSKTAASVPLRTPAYYAVRLALVLVVYGASMVAFKGLRPDVVLQLARPLFAVEIAMLLLLVLSSTAGAVVAMYPDMYQKHRLTGIPYAVFAVFLLFVLAQLFIPAGIGLYIPTPEHVDDLECTIAIAGFAVLPSLIIFALMRRGNTVHPLRAGALAVLAAAGTGCLILRVIEQNDIISHLLVAHYLPTLGFAAIGAIIASRLLRW